VDDIIWHIFGVMIAIDVYVYHFIMLPKIRKNRKVTLADWGFSINQPLLNVFEYRELCEKDKEPIICYKIQIGLLVLFIVLGIIWVLI